MRIFTEHPRSIGETYLQHLSFALRTGLKMTIGGIACMIHGIFPFLFQKTGSQMLEKLHGDFTKRSDGTLS
jgi:hypothetical protein